MHINFFLVNVSNKRDEIHEMLWDKKMKTSNYNRAISNGGNNFMATNVKASENPDLPRTKREISLQTSKLDRIFNKNY